MSSINFETVDRITVGALGEPGQRTFLLQASSGPDKIALIVEKDQVMSLGEGANELLSLVGLPEPPPTWDAESMSIDETLEPQWRVGEMSLRYERDRDLVVLECKQLVPEGEEGALAHFWLSRSQLGALASYGLFVAAQGRKPCPFCALPMDPQGHECPAVNGHREGYFTEPTES